MEAVAIDDRTVRAYPHLKRILVGSPTGNMRGDGSSVENAAPIEALYGIEDGVQVFIEHWKLTDEEAQELRRGGTIQLKFWADRMPVHGMIVYPTPKPPTTRA